MSKSLGQPSCGKAQMCCRQHLWVIGNEDVLRLEVSMDEVATVHEHNRLGDVEGCEEHAAQRNDVPPALVL